MLARGGGGTRNFGQRSGKPVKLRVYADLNAIYDTGFLPVSVDTTGKIEDPGGLVGMEAAVGAYGTKKWRRSTLGLDYVGTFRHYPEKAHYSGSDHFLGMELTTQLNKRAGVTGAVTAGTSDRVFSIGSFLATAATSATLPGADIFDNRTYFLQGGANLTYQVNNRLSYQVGADAFAVRRHAAGLISSNGYLSNAGVAYRMNRRATVAVIYQYYHFDYPRAFGESDVNLAQVVFGYEFSRRWTTQIGVGAFHADSAGSRVVQADPAVAALLGVGSVVESFSRASTLPSFSASIGGRFRRSSLGLSYARSPNAGNGLTLLAFGESFSGGWSYTADRRFSFGLTSAVSRTSSLSNNVGGDFITSYSGATVRYRVQRFVGLNFGAGYRYANGTVANQLRNAYRITLGISLTPNEFPISIF